MVIAANAELQDKNTGLERKWQDLETRVKDQEKIMDKNRRLIDKGNNLEKEFFKSEEGRKATEMENMRLALDIQNKKTVLW